MKSIFYLLLILSATFLAVRPQEEDPNNDLGLLNLTTVTNDDPGSCVVTLGVELHDDYLNFSKTIISNTGQSCSDLHLQFNSYFRNDEVNTTIELVADPNNSNVSYGSLHLADITGLNGTACMSYGRLVAEENYYGCKFKFNGLVFVVQFSIDPSTNLINTSWYNLFNPVEGSSNTTINNVTVWKRPVWSYPDFVGMISTSCGGWSNVIPSLDTQFAITGRDLKQYTANLKNYFGDFFPRPMWIRQRVPQILPNTTGNATENGTSNGTDNGGNGTDNGNATDNGTDNGTNGTDNGTDNGNATDNGTSNGTDNGSNATDNGTSNGTDNGNVTDNSTSNGTDNGGNGAENGTDNGNATDNGTDNGSANSTDNGASNVTDNGTDNGSSNGTDNSAGNVTDNGTDNGGASNGTDNGADNGTDNGASNGTDNGTDNGNATDNGTDNGSVNGTDNGAVNGTDNGSSNVTDNGTDNGSSNGTDDGSSNGTDNGASNETDDGSNGGVDNETAVLGTGAAFGSVYNYIAYNPEQWKLFASDPVNFCHNSTVTYADFLPDMDFCKNGCDVTFALFDEANNVYILQTNGFSTIASRRRN